MVIDLKKCPMAKWNKREIEIGRKIEMEHTKSVRTATRIAKQHICEFPNYYSKGLLPMERKLKRMAGR